MREPIRKEVAELSRLLDDALSFGPPELGPWLERLHHGRPVRHGGGTSTVHGHSEWANGNMTVQ